MTPLPFSVVEEVERAVNALETHVTALPPGSLRSAALRVIAAARLLLQHVRGEAPPQKGGRP